MNKRGELGKERNFNRGELYTNVLRHVLSDGLVDELEEKMLAGLRQVFSISNEQPECIQKEHQFWSPLREAASVPVRAACDNVLKGILTLDEQRPYIGLDKLDGTLRRPGQKQIKDVLLSLSCLRWSRLLLRTERCDLKVRPVRYWPGSSLHHRLLSMMSSILLSVEHLIPNREVEEAIALLFTNLFEELSFLVECNHADPVANIWLILPQLANTIERQDLSYDSAKLLDTLVRRVNRGRRDKMKGFSLSGCLALCKVMPQNHPLALAADRAIELIDREQKYFPKDYEVKNTRRPKACSELAKRHLQRLIVENKRRETEEIALCKALGKADLSKFKNIFRKIDSSYCKEGLEPNKFAFRHLILQVFPALPNYPRPVVAFIAKSEEGSHNEELKDAWLNLETEVLKEGKVRVRPKFDLASSTSFLSVLLEDSEAINLWQALEKSWGAYDVALFSPNFRRARIWHQFGDLDRTGISRYVDKQLDNEKQYDEGTSMCSINGSRTLLPHNKTLESMIERITQVPDPVAHIID